MERATVFVSYRRREWDKAVLDRVEVFLATLEREGLISVWTDRGIQGGDEWRKEIDATLEGAHIALLLISQDFYTSDFICNVELPRLLSREACKSITLLPVFISPADDERATRTEGEKPAC